MRGFVDLQVNGYMGVDFSAPGLTVENVRKVASELFSRGTSAFCPTLITSLPAIYESNLPIFAKCFQTPDIAPHLLGLHLEGPFISPEDGARGAHPRNAVRPSSVEFFDRLSELAGGTIKILTLAPELPGAMELVRHASTRGVSVAIGHHLADRTTITGACDSGARFSTHLGNGIPNLLARHPNPLWDQLAEGRLAATLITDGHHLDSSFVRVVAAVKGAEDTIVISDSSPIAGFPPGQYVTLGQAVVLETSGKLWNPAGNHLVGSSACMLDCMNWVASLGIFDEPELIRLGVDNPLRLIGASAANLPDANVTWTGERFETGLLG